MNKIYFVWLASLLAIAAFTAVLFGLPGFMTIIGIAALFILPVFFLLRKTELDIDEKIFFSLFTGLGLFPLLVFAINYALPSFRISTVFAFVVVIAIGLIISRLGKKKV